MGGGLVSLRLHGMIPQGAPGVSEAGEVRPAGAPLVPGHYAVTMRKTVVP